MPMNGKENPERATSTKNGVFILRDHSTSSQLWDQADILTSLTIEIWLSRFVMEETHNNGGSIKDL
jgi:hypothetical protein